MTNPELEEDLREAACHGDIDNVKELIKGGVNVNSQHAINGWTALHWAAKMNHLNIVNFLCNHGADKYVETDKGQTAASLTTEDVIGVILMARKDGQILTNTPSIGISKFPSEDGKPLTIVPNYISDPTLVDGIERPEKKPRMDTIQDVSKYQRVTLRTNEEVFSNSEQLEMRVKVELTDTTARKDPPLPYQVDEIERSEKEPRNDSFSDVSKYQKVTPRKNENFLQNSEQREITAVHKDPPLAYEVDEIERSEKKPRMDTVPDVSKYQKVTPRKNENFLQNSEKRETTAVHKDPPLAYEVDEIERSEKKPRMDTVPDVSKYQRVTPRKNENFLQNSEQQEANIKVQPTDTGVYKVCRICNVAHSQSNLIRHLKQYHKVNLADQEVLDVIYALATSVLDKQYKLELSRVHVSSYTPEANGSYEDVGFVKHEAVEHSSEDTFNFETPNRPEESIGLVEGGNINGWVDENPEESDDDIKVTAIVKPRRKFDVKPLLNGDVSEGPTPQHQEDSEICTSSETIEQHPSLDKYFNEKSQVSQEENQQLDDESEEEEEETTDFNPSQIFSSHGKSKRRRKPTKKVQTYLKEHGIAESEIFGEMKRKRKQTEKAQIYFQQVNKSESLTLNKNIEKKYNRKISSQKLTDNKKYPKKNMSPNEDLIITKKKYEKKILATVHDVQVLINSNEISEFQMGIKEHENADSELVGEIKRKRKQTEKAQNYFQRIKESKGPTPKKNIQIKDIRKIPCQELTSKPKQTQSCRLKYSDKEGAHITDLISLSLDENSLSSSNPVGQTTSHHKQDQKNVPETTTSSVSIERGRKRKQTEKAKLFFKKLKKDQKKIKIEKGLIFYSNS